MIRRTEFEYGDGTRDVHEVRPYEPAELGALGEQHGLEPLLVCTWCDESRTPTPDDVRYQLVMRRRRP